jgi:uncharacterized protein
MLEKDVQKIINAIHNDDLNEITFLLEKYKLNDINNIRYKSDTFLMIASKHGNLDIVNLFIKYGANINLYNNFGLNALIHATIYNHVNIVALLIENKSNINVANNYGITALMIASGNGLQHIVSLLLDNQVEINKVDNLKGYTALHCAILYNRANIVALLLNNKANISILCKNGVSPLTYAKKNNLINIITLLEK